ncbi:MAG: hypothetical protein KME16_22755 [Scytolyngbya sp. HA4215-MV1]|jgi:hypothetical protein|nr:hypothetical protein [Scytolyngbya sp. HA4215-MV1]
MVNPANDIARQAREGSVAAIIQVLNDKLADSGVRTRAMLAEGVLQLLCEAPEAEQLEQTSMVDRIRKILETLAPRNIRRVKINSRIVREQQLLWLEEISRDPENQLLWSEEITLAKPSFLQRLQADLAYRKKYPNKELRPQISTGRSSRRSKFFWLGMMGGASLSLVLLAAGWMFRELWLDSGKDNLSVPQSTHAGDRSPSTQVSPKASPSPIRVPSVPSSDPFVTAVRIAEQTATTGQNAKTSAEWLALAAEWQKASDLMNSVSANDKRYATAQDRAARYRQNSEAALQEAQARR